MGSIQFNNSSSNPYNIYINSTLWQTINGGSTLTYVDKLGNYNLEVIQKSGYAVYPTDEKSTGTITACGTQNVNFP